MPGSRHAAVEPARDTLPHGPSVAARQLGAVGLLDAVIALVARQADGPPRQLALRIDAFVAFDQAVNHAHIPVQQRIAPQHLPLGVVHLAGKDSDGRMVADRVVNPPRNVLLAAQAVEHPRQPPLRTEILRVARIDQPVAPGMLLAEHPGVLRGGTVPEEGGEQLRERIGLLAEGPERIQPRRGEVEGGLVTEDRGGQRLAVAREDAAALGGNHLLGEDAARKAVGVVGHLRAEELHPHQTDEHNAPGEDEEHVEEPHPQQNVAFDLRSLRLHSRYQFSMISPGASGS